MKKQRRSLNFYEHGILDRNISRGMRKSIRTNKPGPWEKLVGYSLEDLKYCLECQFTHGMSWGDFTDSKWGSLVRISHIVPPSEFHYTTPDDPGFKAFWSLVNLRPQWQAKIFRA